MRNIRKLGKVKLITLFKQIEGLDNYIDSVLKKIVCENKTKKTFIADFRERIDEYITENEAASLADITAHFGTPDDIAAAFIGSLPHENIKKTYNRKKVFAIILAVLILVITLILVINFFDSHSSNGYVYNRDIIEDTKIFED